MKSKIKSNRTYRQRDCFDLCIQKKIITQCGCFFTRFDYLSFSLSQTRPCLNLTDYKCAEKEYFQFQASKCVSEYCPLECNSIQYDLTVSSLVKPTINDYNAVSSPTPLSYEEWRIQFAYIIVYYSQLEYTLIQETPALTLSNLIANIGGTLGLIVSVSFFTLLEIAELFVMLLHEFL